MILPKDCSGVGSAQELELGSGVALASGALLTLCGMLAIWNAA